MPSEVIYARVPGEVKQAAEAYANRRDLTLAASFAELLRAGLSATNDTQSVARLERRVVELERRLGEETLKREQAEQRLRLLQQAAKSWTDRAEQRVGECPNCKSAIRGHDLFITGHCHDCGAPLSSLLVFEENNGIDEKQLLILMGAVGILLALVMTTRK